MSCVVLFFQAEDGIRDLVRSRGLGDVYKRQVQCHEDADACASGTRQHQQSDASVRRSSAEQQALSLIHI